MLAASLPAAAVQVLVEKGSDVELIKRVGRLGLRNFFRLGLDEGFFAVILLGYLAVSSVSSSSIGLATISWVIISRKFQAVERQDAHHLHQARRQNLLLRNLEMKFWLEPTHEV